MTAALMLLAVLAVAPEGEAGASRDERPPARLTLADAERRAVTHPAAMLAQEQARAAQARATQSRAALLPQISVTANYRETTGNRALRVGQVALLQPGQEPIQPTRHTTDYLNLGVTASQLLYDFGQATGVWRAARAAEDAAGNDARAAALAVQLQVRLDFFATLARRELVGVALEDLDNQQRHLAEVESLIAVQARPPIDLVQARASVGAAELRRIAAENDLALAKADLCRSMGEPAWWADQFEVAGEDLPAIEGEDLDGRTLAADAEGARPDLLSSRQAIDSAERSLASARGGYGPVLRLVVVATDAGPMWDPGPFDSSRLIWNYSAALVMSWTVFDGGRTHGRVAEAEAVLQQVREHRRALLLDLGVEVERARRSVAAAKASVAVASVALANARERLRLANGRYHAGVGTALEVSDAQLSEVGVAAQSVQARYDLATARAQLLHAMGAPR